jgi:hypothetical protein
MKYAAIAVLCLSGGLCATSYADPTANPYQGIVDRNVFGLRPPPPPPSNEPVRPPPPAVALTGITTILGKKLAFMNVQVPPRPGEQAKGGPQSFMLGVGEREGEIEVIDIDEKGGIVKLNDYGVITNVPFAKVPTTPSAPVIAAGIPSPNGNAGGNPGLVQRSIPGLPQRTVRLGNGLQGNPTTGGMNPGLTGTPGATPQSGAMPKETPMTTEEQVVLMEVERERHRNDPNHPPLPPTELTSPEDLKTLLTPGSRLPRGYQQVPTLPQ